MKLISIDSLEEESRTLKFVKNFYGTGFWTADSTKDIQETQFSHRLDDHFINFHIKFSFRCFVLRRRTSNDFELHTSRCSSKKYSICYRKNIVEDDDYDCDE